MDRTDYINSTVMPSIQTQDSVYYHAISSSAPSRPVMSDNKQVMWIQYTQEKKRTMKKQKGVEGTMKWREKRQGREGW